METQFKHIFMNGSITYERLVDFPRFRIAHAITTVSAHSVITCLRILTQYMVCQYCFYKSHVNLKLEVLITFQRLIVFFIMGLFVLFVNIFNICIVLSLLYETILLFISSTKLCHLLQQRLRDADTHENQPRGVINYYIVAFLIGFVIQNTGTFLYCLHPIMMGLVYYPGKTHSQDHKILPPLLTVTIEIYDLLINSLQLVLMS